MPGARASRPAMGLAALSPGYGQGQVRLSVRPGRAGSRMRAAFAPISSGTENSALFPRATRLAGCRSLSSPRVGARLASIEEKDDATVGVLACRTDALPGRADRAGAGPA